MSQPQIRELWCAPSDDLEQPFPVECVTDQDNIHTFKKKIWDHAPAYAKKDAADFGGLRLYRPVVPLDNGKAFKEEDGVFLNPRQMITSLFPESKDPYVDIVVVVSVAKGGATPGKQKLSVSQSGLTYRPPRPSTLLNSPGRTWDYQVSEELTNTLHTEVYNHFKNYKQGFVDKTTIPLYLFLSGAGTGKSRNSSELWKTTSQCFNGNHFQEMDELAHELAHLISNAFVFHVSLENGTSLRPHEEDPVVAIGSRMLLQLIQDDNRSALLEEIDSNFYPTTPSELIQFFIKQGPPRAFFLIVDGLKNINDRFGESKFMSTLSALGDVAQQGFTIVCGTSTVSDTVEKFLKGSRRRGINLPCMPLDVPKINKQPVFDPTKLVQKVLIEDCGGHGRALELLMSIKHEILGDPGPGVECLLVGQLRYMYRGVLPGEHDAKAIVQVVMGHRQIPRYNKIPGTSMTVDEVMENGLMRFEATDDSENPSGYLTVPYVWLLALASSHLKNPFFAELQMLDYRDFMALEDPNIPGSSSWPDFECAMVKLRKIKSRVFENNNHITLGDIHHGAYMTDETKAICIQNHHLSDDVAEYQEMSKTVESNRDHWIIPTKKSGKIDLREHKYIIRNAASAPAADAVISLDTKPVRNECFQFKNTRESTTFHQERKKAAAPDDIFVFFTTSSIPSLKVDGDYNVPSRSVVVTEENWQHYFGPYAARSYLFAKQFERSERSERSAALSNFRQ